MSSNELFIPMAGPLPPGVEPEDVAFYRAAEALGENPRPERLAEIAVTARALPASLGAALSEWRTIQARNEGRGPIYANPVLFRIYQERAYRIARLLDGALPAQSPADVRARLAWLREGLDGKRPEGASVRALLGILDKDLEGLAAPAPPPAPGGPPNKPKSATERRAAVVARLCDPEYSRWSDRAIARVCGVSPQTVGNWRRKLSDHYGQDGPDPEPRLFRRGGRTHLMKVGGIGQGRGDDSEI